MGSEAQPLKITDIIGYAVVTYVRLIRDESTKRVPSPPFFLPTLFPLFSSQTAGDYFWTYYLPYCPRRVLQRERHRGCGTRHDCLSSFPEFSHKEFSF